MKRSVRINALLERICPGLSLVWDGKTGTYKMVVRVKARDIEVTDVVSCGYCDGFVLRTPEFWGRCTVCGAL